MVDQHDYSRIVSSLLFAGTLCGMLVFGEITGWAFLLSHPNLSKAISPTKLDANLVWYGSSLYPHLEMIGMTVLGLHLPSDECHWYSRTVLPAVCGIIWRTWEHNWDAGYAECDAVYISILSCTTPCTIFIPVINSFLIGIGVGAEYPCGSVSASEQSEEPGISKKAQHRWFALATSVL